MRGIIVLDGGDGTGKTTLARALMEKHDAFYIHNGLWPNMWQRHLAAVDLAIKKSRHQLVVIDRLYLSEQIYGQVFRAGPSYDLGARCLDRILQRYGALNVLCVRRDLKRHVAHFEELRTRRPEKFNSMKVVAQRYYDLLEGNLAYGDDFYVNQLTRFQDYAARMDVLHYDMDRQGGGMRVILDQMEDRLRMIPGTSLPDQYNPDRRNLAGNYGATRYLFVGEDLSPRACRRAAPFLWNDEASAATWLNNALRELQFDETTALWTNTSNADDWLPVLRDMLSATVRVIALGAVASNRVEQLRFQNVRYLPHPQWARRFQAKQPRVYRDVMRDALYA